MEAEAAAKKNLYEAATRGEVARFIQLLEEDPYLVDEVQFAYSRNILHVATMQGQAGIVEEIIKGHPQLASELDTRNSSPLHIAAAKGNLEIVAMLLRIAPEMCWGRDGQGMNPFHIAAMNRVDVQVLEKLLLVGSRPAMERLHRGQTVLHLCVKQDNVRALDLFANWFRELVYATDDDGETILHLAVRCNSVETVRHLVEKKIIKKLTPNSAGKTPLDVLEEISRNRYAYKEIKEIITKLSEEEQPLWKTLPKLTDMTMVVAVLIATMAFNAAVSPPGGVWPDDTSSHRAGKTVMASTHPQIYGHFVRANTTAFLSSLLTIFLITTQQPSKNYYYLLMSMTAAWVALASIAVSYGASVVVIAPHTEKKSLYSIIITAVVSLGIIIISPLVYHLYQSIKAILIHLIANYVITNLYRLYIF